MKNIDNPREKIIIALDGMDKNNVFNLLEKIPEIIWVKVGLELFVSEGPDVLSILRDKGKKIFLDLKFHDITNTVIQSCIAASNLGVWMLNIHSSSGKNTMVNSIFFELRQANYICIKRI